VLAPPQLGVLRPAWGNCSVFDGRWDEPQLRFRWHFRLPLILLIEQGAIYEQLVNGENEACNFAYARPTCQF
jgi:hypothetical protein